MTRQDGSLRQLAEVAQVSHTTIARYIREQRGEPEPSRIVSFSASHDAVAEIDALAAHLGVSRAELLRSIVLNSLSS